MRHPELPSARVYLCGLSRELKAEDLFHPRLDPFPKFFQSALKKVIRAFDHYQLLRVRNGSNQSFQFRPWTKLIARTADEQLRVHAVVQEIEGVNARFLGIGGNRGHRYSNRDQGPNARVGIRRAQSDGRTEGKSGKDQRQMKFPVEPIERRPNIFNLTLAVVVFALAQSRAAEIKPQHGKSEPVQGLHRVEDDLIVECSAELGMRMADERGVRGIFGSGIEQSFETSCGAVQEQRSNRRSR